MIHRHFLGFRFLFPTLALLIIGGCEQPALLQRIQSVGVLRIATIPGPLTCQMGEGGPEGLEYELANAFARSLAVKAEFMTFDNRQAAVLAVKTGAAHMAAAMLIPSASQRRGAYLSVPWYHSTFTFASNMGTGQFEQLEQPLVIPAPSIQQDLLATWPAVNVSAHPSLSEEEILVAINAGEYTHTLAPTHLLDHFRSMFPYLAKGTQHPADQPVRWMFSRAQDPSLKLAADRFLQSWQQSGKLDELLKRHLHNLPQRNFVTRRDFWLHLEERLPRYLEMYRQAGVETGIDWRLLAAIGYQESHWDPLASSPTGVKGIMMLTRSAAKQQNISDRTDPGQSIAGGARHLLWMEKRIPKRIQGNDLLWFTLAAYNIGYGHLEDARVLTERQNGDPDHWDEVKERLPLLSEKKFYATVKHGRARGQEPVTYVENIRYYYRLLVWWDNRRRGLDCTSPSPDDLRLALKN